ncbi:MAG TPA: hypothetical protein VFM54_08760 [Micromonosporaceae bacterium]|nr:hypothetical protein [Micromonosporaceae bacterium]
MLATAGLGGLLFAAPAAVPTMVPASLRAAAFVLLGALAGLAASPVSSAVRALYARLLDTDRLRSAAYSLDAVSLELVFLVGPAVVAVFITLGVGPRAALVAAGALAFAGTAAFAAAAGGLLAPVPKAERGGADGGVSGMWLVVAATLPLALSWGTVEVAVSAAAVTSGRPAAAGPLLGLWVAGGIVGGLAFGARSWPGSPGRQAVVLFALVGLATLVLPLAASLVVLGVGLFVAGLPGSPASAAAANLIAARVPAQRHGEAYGWFGATYNVGVGLGYVTGGSGVEAVGSAATFAVGGAFAIAAAVLLLPAWRREVACATG